MEHRLVYQVTNELLDYCSQSKSPSSQTLFDIESKLVSCGGDDDDSISPTADRCEQKNPLNLLISRCCKGTASRMVKQELSHLLASSSSCASSASASSPCQFDSDKITFRRITRRRLQAMHTLPNSTLAFVYESTSLFMPHWLLRRIKLNNDDDEEYYWKPWEPTIAQADEIYEDQRRASATVKIDDVLQIKEQLLKTRVSSSSSCSSTASGGSDSSAFSRLSVSTQLTEPPLSNSLYGGDDNDRNHAYHIVSESPDPILHCFQNRKEQEPPIYEQDDDDYWDMYDSVL